jgi:uncharacterized phage-associated protein
MSTADQPSAIREQPHESDRERAKRVIVEILRLGGNHTDSSHHLCKTFYYAHLYYARKSPGYLTDWPIVAMEGGPGIGSYKELIKELVAENKIVTKRVNVGPFPTTEYTLIDNSIPDLNADEIEAIKQAVEFVKPYTPEQLSQLTHRYSRSWKSSKEEGDELNIYVDLLTDEEFEQRRARLKQISPIFDEVWGTR